jgi:predicted N-acetyltransferase YhbS
MNQWSTSDEKLAKRVMEILHDMGYRAFVTVGNEDYYGYGTPNVVTTDASFHQIAKAARIAVYGS